ncbi:hypothetical protein SK128_007917 [Halocaridina rubra]|uniref:RAP domain-containing protein n=1 Tax=Halocaridina rubra TaxID=373956 RepID=A0AAN8WXT0_HALRR
MASISLIRNGISMIGKNISVQRASLFYTGNILCTNRLPVVYYTARHNSGGHNPLAFKKLSSQPKSIIKASENDDENVLQVLEEEAPESPDREYMLPSQRRKEYSDLLIKRIVASDNIKDLLDIYQKHSDVMDDRHLLKVLQGFNALVAKGYEDCSSLHENELFHDICLRLYKSSRRMDVSELVYLLQYLCRLQVPAKSKLVQAVLQLLRHSLNDLDLRLIVQLEFILKKLPLTPLSEGMLMAIPPIMENVLSQEPLDSLSMKQLSQALSICASGGVRNMGLILQEIYKRGNIRSGNLAMTFMWSLVDMYSHSGKPVPLSKDDTFTREVLLKECMDVFAKNLEMFRINQIETVLGKLCKAYKNQDSHSYNEYLFNLISKTVVERKVEFTKIAHIIRRLLKMNFLSEHLVSYVVSLATKYPEEVIHAQCPVSPLISAIVAAPDFDVTHIDAIKVILKHHSLNIDPAEPFRLPILHVTLDLLSVGFYHEPFLDVLTSEEYLSQYMEKYTLGYVTSKQLLQLNQVLTVLEKTHYRIPEKFLMDPVTPWKDLPPAESALCGKLQQLLGDQDFFVSGVVTENDIYFDHLIVLDDDGYPVKIAHMSVSQETNRICDLSIPMHTKRIAILDIRPSDSYGPKNLMKRYLRLDQQLLEASGYIVIPIFQSVIGHLTADEKNLYIKSLLEKSGVIV